MKHQREILVFARCRQDGLGLLGRQPDPQSGHRVKLPLVLDGDLDQPVAVRGHQLVEIHPCRPVARVVGGAQLGSQLRGRLRDEAVQLGSRDHPLPAEQLDRGRLSYCHGGDQFGQFATADDRIHQLGLATELIMPRFQAGSQLDLQRGRGQLEQRRDPGQRQLQPSQPTDQPGAGNLIAMVVAVTGRRVDLARHQQSQLGIKSQRLRRQAGLGAEAPSQQVRLVHTRKSAACPWGEVNSATISRRGLRPGHAPPGRPRGSSP